MRASFNFVVGLRFCLLTHIHLFVLVAIHQENYRIPSAQLDKEEDEFSQHHGSGVVKDISRRSNVRVAHPPASVRNLYFPYKVIDKHLKLEPTVDSIGKAGSVGIKSRHDIGLSRTHYGSPNHAHLPKSGFEEHLGYHAFTPNDGLSTNNYRVPRNKSKGSH